MQKMSVDKQQANLSPTVLQVLEAFAKKLRDDESIPDDAAERLESLLKSGDVPKPDDIAQTMFPSAEDEQA